jgi:hypothetical protein
LGAVADDPNEKIGLDCSVFVKVVAPDPPKVNDNGLLEAAFSDSATTAGDD